MKHPDTITDVLNNTKFCVNLQFLYEFLVLFNECFSLFKQDIQELIKSPLHLRFLSEIFCINFCGLKDRIPENDFKLLLYNVFDFKLNITVGPNRPFDLSEKVEYGRYNAKLNNLIKSTKITLTELLNSMIVMQNFSHFTYSWFADFRLRIYLIGSSLNPTLPFARNFLQFHDIIPISKFDADDLRAKLLEQLRAVATTITFRFIPIENIDYRYILMNCPYKFGEASTFFHLFHDIANLDNKNYVFRFRSMINYDSTNSGTQMISLNIRSKSVGASCKLVKSQAHLPDIYQDFLDHLSSIAKKIRNLTKPVFESFPLLQDFLDKHTQKVLDLKYTPNQELLSKEPLKIFSDTTEYAEKYFTLITTSQAEALEIIGNFSIITDVIDFSEFENLIPYIIRKKFNMADGMFPLDLKHFIILTEMHTYTYLFNHSLIKDIYSRKLVKQMFMTSLYGSTAFGRMSQMMDQFYKICLTKGNYPSNRDFILVYYFCGFINTFLIPWRTNKHPKLMLFYQMVRESCKPGNPSRERFSSFDISSPYSKFSLRPLRAQSMYINLNYKRFRYTYRIPGELDFRRIARSFVANYMHFCDATIVYLFYKHLKLSSLQGFTVHDRFFMHPATGLRLYGLLQVIYLAFYKLDLFKHNFTGTRLIHAYTNRKSTDYLLVTDLLHKDFVKS
jgi:hypothetical protein